MRKGAIVSSIILACTLHLLPGCAPRTAQDVSSLPPQWTRKGQTLVHPDKTVIRFEKPRYYKGRLTEKRRDNLYQMATPKTLLTSWGLDGSSSIIVRFSKKWEPPEASGGLEKFIMEMDYICPSPGSEDRGQEKMTMKRVIIYRHMGGDVTNRMGIGIIGYSDRVASHTDEFSHLVDSILTSTTLSLD